MLNGDSRVPEDSSSAMRAWKRKVTVTVSCALLASPVRGLAQTQVPEVRLGKADASLSQGFTRIASIVELSDGQLVIVDSRERRLSVADLSSGTVRDIGQVGQGPGEYMMLTGAFRLGADSVLIIDAQQRRGLILVDERIVATISSNALRGAALGASVTGADSRGFLLSKIERPVDQTSLASGRALQDSIGLVIAHRSSGVADTVAKIGPSALQLVSTSTRGTVFRLNRPVLAAEEEALLFSDGWLAIARLHPYRIDWRDPRGVWTHGPPLPFEEIDIDDREKQSYRAYLAAIGQPDVRTDAVWPRLAPPFFTPPNGYGVLAPGPRGLLLVKRVPTADRFVSWYDVIDRRGTLTARLVLEVNQRILAVGERGVYVVSSDNVGLEYVHRYALPRLP
jgi:hypothetical protein